MKLLRKIIFLNFSRLKIKENLHENDKDCEQSQNIFQIDFTLQSVESRTRNYFSNKHNGENVIRFYLFF